jgi:hypothetical protein
MHGCKIDYRLKPDTFMKIDDLLIREKSLLSLPATVQRALHDSINDGKRKCCVKDRSNSSQKIELSCQRTIIGRRDRARRSVSIYVHGRHRAALLLLSMNPVQQDLAHSEAQWASRLLG